MAADASGEVEKEVEGMVVAATASEREVEVELAGVDAVVAVWVEVEQEVGVMEAEEPVEEGRAEEVPVVGASVEAAMGEG